MKTVALIVAAGKGIRFGGDAPKQFRKVNGRPLLTWTALQFEKAATIDETILVVAEDFLLYANETVAAPYTLSKLSKIVVGGETRQESVNRGLESLPISTGYVAIHDGARPVVSPNDIDRVVEVARMERAAILARPIPDTVKRVESDFIISTLDRSKLYLAETPQVFQYDIIMSAHRSHHGNSDLATDDAFLVEVLGFKVRTVVPENPNIKVTTEDDLKLVGILLEGNHET
jgi:2-C-methyl-D-erythritol 4-phosphate cytidylyltransferase